MCWAFYWYHLSHTHLKKPLRESFWTVALAKWSVYSGFCNRHRKNYGSSLCRLPLHVKLVRSPVQPFHHYPALVGQFDGKNGAASACWQSRLTHQSWAIRLSSPEHMEQLVLSPDLGSYGEAVIGCLDAKHPVHACPWSLSIICVTKHSDKSLISKVLYRGEHYGQNIFLIVLLFIFFLFGILW